MNSNKPSSRRARDIGFWAMIIVILLATFYIMMQPSGDEPGYSDIVALFKEEKVESFTTEGNLLVLNLYAEEGEEEGKTITYEMADFSIFYNDLNDLIMQQKEDGILKEYDYTTGFVAPWWMQLLPYLVLMAISFGFVYVMMNRAGGGGAGGAAKFGKARTRLGSEEKKKVTFADVAGADEEKEELQEVVEFLKNPSAYTDMGARIPKGVLLVGPPGTGKTLIAKAVAGEAGVQFLSISGSDFVELYVGVGASRVRDLFDQAKKVAPAIIFIDEIDAVGRKRGAGMGGGHDEREQTLNQLLVEMDGFGNNEGVIVMAATNRKDILDNALLRPGRFDRQVYIGLPDVRGREAILKVHARGKRLGEDVDLASIARGTPGFSGADLANLLNEAALLAVRRGKRFITMADADEAILKVLAGPEKKSRIVSERERKLTAYHEAGHAVVSKYLKHTSPVHHITIIPRGPAGGMTIYRPTEDKSFNSRSEMFEDIVVSLGGRVAEELMMDDISTGAAGDIQQATSTARAMVTRYGMSEKVGPISFESGADSVFIGRDFAQTKGYSEKMAALIDDEVKHIFDEAKALCKQILSEHQDVLTAIAEYLLIHETMEGSDFDYFCEHGELPPKPEPVVVEELKEETVKFPEEPNKVIHMETTETSELVDESPVRSEEPQDEDETN